MYLIICLYFITYVLKNLIVTVKQIYFYLHIVSFIYLIQCLSRKKFNTTAVVQKAFSNCIYCICFSYKTVNFYVLFAFFKQFKHTIISLLIYKVFKFFVKYYFFQLKSKRVKKTCKIVFSFVFYNYTF